MAGPFDPKYIGDYRVIAIKGNQVEVRDVKKGNLQKVHITDCKYIWPVDAVIKKIPNIEYFGRKTKLRLNPNEIPDLKWNLNSIRPKNSKESN